MICPYCNTQLDDNASFCYKCGSSISQKQVTGQQSSVQQAEGQYAQSPTNPQNYNSQQFAPQPIVKKSPAAIALAIIFAVLTFSLLGTTLFFYTKYADAKAVVASYEEKEQKEKEEKKKESKYRAEDVSTAEYIREAILADIADQVYPFNDSYYYMCINGEYIPSAISEAPTIKAKDHKGSYFLASWNSYSGTCDVYDSTGQYLLTDPQGATDYKNNTPAGVYTPTTY